MERRTTIEALRRASACAFASLTGSIAGCSLAIDTDTAQCSAAIDCGTFNGAAIYGCVSGICSELSCDADRECAARGSFVCDQGYCAPALCLSDSQCQAAGATSVCIDGRCKDPILYCFDQRLSTESADAPVLKFTLLGFADKQPVKSVQTTVCIPQSQTCTPPVPAQTEYDPSTGALSIRGLKNGQVYNVRWTATGADGSKFIETEYAMMRPVVGTTIEPVPTELVTPGLVGLLAQQSGAPWDSSKGLVVGQVFGCDYKPVAGASLADSREGLLFFLTATTDITARETDNSGMVGFSNMAVAPDGTALNHKLTLLYKGYARYSYSITPRPNVMTYISFFMQDYGNTIDRVAVDE